MGSNYTVHHDVKMRLKVATLKIIQIMLETVYKG